MQFAPCLWSNAKSRQVTGRETKGDNNVKKVYSIDHIAEDHIHTDITCNIEELQQKYHPGTVSNRFYGAYGANKRRERYSSHHRW